MVQLLENDTAKVGQKYQNKALIVNRSVSKDISYAMLVLISMDVMIFPPTPPFQGGDINSDRM